MNFLDSLLIDLQFLSYSIIPNFNSLSTIEQIFYTSIPTLFAVPLFIGIKLIIDYLKGEETKRPMLKEHKWVLLLLVICPGTFILCFPFLAFFYSFLLKWTKTDFSQRIKKLPENQLVFFVVLLSSYYVVVSSLQNPNTIYLNTPIKKVNIKSNSIEAIVSLNLITFYAGKKY